jgi:hypothetical protein
MAAYVSVLGRQRRVGASPHVTPRTLAFGFAVACFAFATAAEAADLQPATSAAFDRYVQLTEARMNEEAAAQGQFLWIDRLPEAQRRAMYAQLDRGQIVVSRLETRDHGAPVKIPDGLCHHWIGTVFAPDVPLERVVSLMQSYDRYPDLYRPNVRRARILAREGDRFQVYLQLFMKKVISVVLNSEYDVQYVAVNAQRMRVRSFTTRIAEVDDSDTPREREKPVGHDNGFLWRFNNYCLLEVRDAGTYVQCESVSLSRAIPTGLGWLIGPFVTAIPRSSLEFTLGSLRAAATTRR